ARSPARAPSDESAGTVRTPQRRSSERPLEQMPPVRPCDDAVWEFALADVLRAGRQLRREPVWRIPERRPHGQRSFGVRLRAREVEIATVVPVPDRIELVFHVSLLATRAHEQVDADSDAERDEDPGQGSQRDVDRPGRSLDEPGADLERLLAE